MADGAKRIWGWVAEGFILLVGLGIAAYFRALGNKRAAALARADADEEVAKRRVATHKAEIERLFQDYQGNELEIAKLKRAINAERDKLHAKFDEVEEDVVTANRLYYLAMPPRFYEKIVANLGDCGLLVALSLLVWVAFLAPDSWELEA